jgi:hypothetical protein
VRRAALASAIADTAKIRDLDIAPRQNRTTTILFTHGCIVLATNLAEWMPLSPTYRAPFGLGWLAIQGRDADEAKARSPPAILGASILYSRKKQPRQGGWSGGNQNQLDYP